LLSVAWDLLKERGMKGREWWIAGLPILIAVSAVSFYALDSYRKADEKGAVAPCIANLKQLDGAKNSWALEYRKTTNDTPTDSDLFGPNGYIQQKPSCPEGGIYLIGKVGESPRCTIPQHSLDIGLVEVVDQSGKPVAGARIAVEKQAYETTAYGMGWANTNQSSARRIIVSKSGYSTEQITLPVSMAAESSSQTRACEGDLKPMRAHRTFIVATRDETTEGDDGYRGPRKGREHCQVQFDKSALATTFAGVTHPLFPVRLQRREWTSESRFEDCFQFGLLAMGAHYLQEIVLLGIIARSSRAPLNLGGERIR
jgi:hypothetical protein